jgi:hypothetical protein
MSKIFSQYHTLRLPACLGIEFLLISGAVMLAALLRFSQRRFALDYFPRAILTAFV